MTDRSRIAVVDVETTGLSPWRHDRIVEIGIVVVDESGRVVEEYETLINPNRDMGPTSIHQIAASDVLRAPAFENVAGDVLSLLSGSAVLAGHNVSFDKNFLINEFQRIGIELPDFPLICTSILFGRASLAACCRDLGIQFTGMQHRALMDARATAAIIGSLCSDAPGFLEHYLSTKVDWPSLPSLGTPCFCREDARRLENEPPRFLSRIIERIHHDVDADAPNVLAYLTLVDRVLEDRVIDNDEENALVEAALSWGLTQEQVESAHMQYVQNLAVAALADGIVSDAERRDLHLVSRLLGIDETSIDSAIDNAARQLRSARPCVQSGESVGELSGLRVCFTGQLQATIEGQPISRDLAEALATEAGLVVASNVTKKLDLLVVADPNTQSGKAKKARDYGIRVLSDIVFWRLAGIEVD